MKKSGFKLALFLGFLIFSDSFQSVAQKENQQPAFRKARHGVYVLAHRGAHIGIPENSLAAYQKAIDLGCDFVEIDVRTTKDGKFVSIHNGTIEQYVSDRTGKVSEMALAELKLLDIGSRIGSEWKDTRIPTFEEILKLCQGKIGIYLDLKAAPIPKLVKIIRKYRMEKDIIWYIPASRMKELRQLNEICPDCIPMPDPGPEENITTVLNQVKTRTIATDPGELSKSFVETAHRHQAMVFADEKEGTASEWTQMIDWNTDGIQTDHPEELISFLKSRR